MLLDFQTTVVLVSVAIATVLSVITLMNTNILDPRDTYADAAEWTKKAEDLAARFIKNFKKYEGNEAGKALVAAGPKL